MRRRRAKPSTTASPTEPVVLVEQATKTYGGGDAEVQAVRGVDLMIPRGRFLAIMGPSGSGKSTLLRCAAGLESLTTGTATLLGRDLTTLSETGRTLLRRSHAAFVFQDYTLLPTLDVWHNVAVPFTLAGRVPPVTRIEEIFHTMGLAGRQRELPHQLSGGQQQRVAIARALAADADVIFADEPTGALDSATARVVLAELRSVIDRNRSMLMVTHDPVAASHADEVLFLLDGRIAKRLDAPTADDVTMTLLQLSSEAA
ncbi:MAG: ABC transporter ATP-binding protein [Nocardioidaceae bacterium]